MKKIPVFGIFYSFSELAMRKRNGTTRRIQLFMLIKPGIRTNIFMRCRCSLHPGPVFASGPRAYYWFGGIQNNADIYNIIKG